MMYCIKNSRSNCCNYRTTLFDDTLSKYCACLYFIYVLKNKISFFKSLKAVFHTDSEMVDFFFNICFVYVALQFVDIFIFATFYSIVRS